ncbi:hypothetical protein [Mangrovibacterium sp.]|uniref:hypothetical protein n=1 Tax=Mangrovibacterium sp. TaxID=1961364 RepID=UPI003568D44B
MKQFLFLILIALFSLKSTAQADSVALEFKHAEYDFLYQELFNFDRNSTFGELDNHLKSPQLHFQTNDILKLEITSPQIVGFQSERPMGMMVQTPFSSNYIVNSAAIYRLSDKLKVGGSSFSANSVFSSQPFSFDPSKMNFQGVNLFLEYKVSDKFRIGGGVQINQSSGY